MRLLGAAALAIAIIGTIFFSLLAFSAQNTAQERTLSYLQGSDAPLPFTDEANQHLRDVRRVLNGARILTALAIISAFLLLSRPAATGGGLLLVGLPPTLAALPWDAIFTGMHAVLFPQGNWRFPAGSLLISTYPESYFQEFAIAWGVLTMAAGALLLLGSRYAQKPRA